MAITKRTIVYQSLDKEALFELLSAGQISLNNYALILLNNLKYTPQREDSEIIITELSLEDLNFSAHANYTEISNVIADFGYKHCPMELAPYIRMAYLDQTNSLQISKNQHPKDSILIFSKPLSYKEDFPKGFYIRKIEDRLWLRGYRCSEDYKWDPDIRLIVCNK